MNPLRDFKSLRLSNGLRLRLRRDATLPLASFQVWIRCGSVDEERPVAGLAHFLEHMVFKASPSARDLSRIVESSGGVINAATQHELTHYYTDIPREGLETAIDALGQALTNPRITPEETEKERRVIFEEMARRDDSPNAVLWDRFMSSIFQGTPYGKCVIGNHATVSRVRPRHLIDFHKRHYTASRMVIACAGDFSEERLTRQIEAAFRKIPRGVGESNGAVSRSFKKAGPPITLRRPVQQGYIACGFHTPGLSNPDLVTLDVAADLLGGGASSRLYRRLREERQLLWSVGANIISYRHSGILGIFAETPWNNLEKSVAAIREETERFEEEPATEAEVQRAKARIRSEWIGELETLHGQASLIGHLAALGREKLATAYLGDLDKVRSPDIHAVWRKILKGKPMTVAMLRPQKP